MAKVFLDSGENIRVLDNATIIGKGVTYETVRIIGIPSINMDANIDRVEFTGNINQYTFEVAGTLATIRSDGNIVARFSGIEDDGVTLAFADGSALLELKGLGNATLGSLALSTQSGGSALAPSLNTSDKSTVGDYTAPDPTTQSVYIDQGDIESDAVQFDASTGSFKFIEDPTKANNVEISGFSSDDVIEVTQTPDADYLFSSEEDDAVISLNISGVISSIILVGVLSGDVVIDGSYESFQQAVRADAFTFA